MTAAGADHVASLLRQHRDELTRIWRMARASARPEIFPGLLDGIVPSFLDRCADHLARGGPPEDVCAALTGVVRWPPALAAAETKTEWTILGEVVAIACEALECDPAVVRWLRDAASACRDCVGAIAHGRGRRPPGVVTAIVYSSVAPRRLASPEHGADA